MIKEKVRKWLFPELTEMKEMLDAIKTAALNSLGDDKVFEIKNHFILVGTLNQCNVQIRPDVNVDLTLGKVDIASALNVTGTIVNTSHNSFVTHPIKVKNVKKVAQK